MLDDIKNIQKIDSNNVMDSIAMFPKQAQQAWEESSSIEFPDEYKSIDNIIVCGMGGSSFTPKTIKELYSDKITKPYEIINDYNLPHYANEKSLVILSSYSGTTEEVLSCLRQAQSKNTKITAISKGGKLEEFLINNNLPGYIFTPKHNPSNQPRVGAGYTLFGHLGILFALGFVQIKSQEVSEAIKYASTISKQMSPQVKTQNNPAKKLALTLKDTHPILVSAEHLRGFVNGFANQINETAKMISDYRYIPELNHHLMEGLKNPNNLKQNILFVFLNSNLYSHKISTRFKVTKEVVEKQKINTHQIELTSDTKLKQIMEGFTLSGYTTMYLATLYQTNPAEIPWVNHFKAKLKELS